MQALLPVCFSNGFEIRLILEIGMADLLFYRITKEDIAELRKIVSQ